jgi:hypothetical protein
MSMFAGLLAMMFSASGANPAQAEDKSPVGSWFVYICPGSSDPCTTDSPIINLTSFTKDGVTMGADFGANPWPSPGLGVWAKTGPDQYGTTFYELLSDAQGALVGRVKLRGALKYDRKSDTLAGPFKGEFTDPSGQNVLDHFEGTGLLTRMQLEPLP